MLHGQMLAGFRHALLVHRALDDHDTVLSVLLALLNLKNSLISDKSFLRLLASLIQDTQVVPNFVEFRLEGCGLDDVVESLFVLALLVVEVGQGSPEDSFIWTLVSCIVEVVVSFLSFA